MAMSLPFFGGEMSAFTPSSGGISEDTTSGFFDPSVSRCGIMGSLLHATATSPTWTAASTMWFHGCIGLAAQSGGGKPNDACINFYNGSTVVAYLLIKDTPPDLFSWWQGVFYTLQSGAMTGVGTPIYFQASVPTMVDVQFVAGASGAISFYLSGTLVFSATGLNHSGWSSGITSVQIVTLDANFAGLTNSCWWSQIICDTACTIGRQLITDNFNTESAANTGWATYGGGTKVANVNKIAWNDSTGLDASTTGLIESFYQSGISFGTYNVLARGVSARLGYHVTAPTQAYVLLRVSSTNYLSSANALTTDYTPVFYSWATNPATSAAWTPSAAASVEAGVQSLT